MLGIRVTRAADEWFCLAALVCQPFIPPIPYGMMAEILQEHARQEAPRRDDDWRAFHARSPRVR